MVLILDFYNQKSLYTDLGLYKDLELNKAKIIYHQLMNYIKDI